MFLILFLISEQKKGVVGDFDEWRDAMWCWKLQWRRDTFKWEKQLIFQLQSCLENSHVQRDALDSWSWKPCSLETYSTKSW